MNIKKTASMFCLAIGLTVFAAVESQAATFTVGNATSGSCPHDYTTIQSAVNAAAAGDVVSVCPGTYDEQVAVTTSNLTITGSGQDITIIRPTNVADNSSSLFSGNPVAAIVVVDGAIGVTIEALTVNGDIAAPYCAPHTYIGVFYRASSGEISNTHVTNILNALSPGCQGYLGIFVQSGNGGPALNSNVVITDNIIDNYGKNGITANEAGSSVTVAGNIIRGQGNGWLAAQNGVQLGFGAHGKVTNNTIKDNYYSSPQYVACGILAVNGGGAIGQTKSNTFSGNSVNVCTAGNGPSANAPFNRY